MAPSSQRFEADGPWFNSFKRSIKDDMAVELGALCETLTTKFPQMLVGYMRDID